MCRVSRREFDTDNYERLLRPRVATKERGRAAAPLPERSQRHWNAEFVESL